MSLFFKNKMKGLTLLPKSAWNANNWETAQKNNGD